AGMQRLSSNSGIIFPNGLVKRVSPTRVYCVIHSIDPFRVWPKTRYSRLIQCEMHTQPFVIWQRVNQARKRGFSGERKIATARQIQFWDGICGNPFNMRTDLLRSQTGAVDQLPTAYKGILFATNFQFKTAADLFSLYQRTGKRQDASLPLKVA